jgi:F-type H+-transporting ATPase subunit b
MAAAPHPAEHASDAAHAADAAHGGAAGGFPPFDASLFTHQLVWFAITFGVLYWLMSRFALPKVAQVLETRASTLKADLDEAASRGDAAETARQQAERASAAARAEARKTIDDMLARTQAELAADQAKADAALAERIAAAEKRIGAAQTKALAGVDEVAGDIAKAIVAKLAPGGAR